MPLSIQPPLAPLLLLPFCRHSAPPCFKRTSVLCCLMPRLSALVPLLRTLGQMKTATNPGSKTTAVSVFLQSWFSKPHKYRHHPYGILSALLGWFVHWELWKCLCSLLSQAIIHLNYTSAQHHGPAVKKTWSHLIDFDGPRTSRSILLPWPPHKFVMGEWCCLEVGSYGCTLQITHCSMEL